jgi:tetratricopeptide (TPR) repeat protein
LAEIAITRQKSEEALNWCNEAVLIEPQNETARILKAVALKAAGKYEPARKAFDGILRASPRNTTALLQLGLLEIEQKNFKAAEALFVRLEKQNAFEAAGGLAAMFVAQDRSIGLLKS